jgi:hypothetical protein
MERWDADWKSFAAELIGATNPDGTVAQAV